MKYRSLLFILCILGTLILSGCWDRYELDELSISHAMGIDLLEDGQIQLTLQMLKPMVGKSRSLESSSNSGDGEGSWVTTTTGRTLFEAARNGRDKISRKNFLGRNKILVIGEEAAKSGISPLLDFYVRRHDIRELTYIFIAKGRAQTILEAQSEQENDPAKALENLAQATGLTSKSTKTTLLDVMKSLVSKTSEPFISGLELIEHPSDKTTKKFAKLSETAVFKDNKLVGWFNERETRGLLWILGEVKSGIIVVNSPGDDAKKAAIEIIKASNKIKPEFIEGKPTMTVYVEEVGNLGEQMSSVDLTALGGFSELESRQAVVIRDEIKAALQKAQTLGSDVFKFGVEFHRKFPKEFLALEKNWEEEFSNMTVDIEVKAKLNGYGLSSKPLGTKRKE